MGQLKLILLIFAVFSHQQLVAKPIMFIALPRSGSTFFCQILCKALNGNYYMAPPWAVDKKKNTISMGNCFFGGPYQLDCWNLKHNMFETMPEEQFDYYYHTHWKQSKLTSSKEVMSYGNIDHYLKKFRLVGLFRHRMYTFPTSNVFLFPRMYESFMQARFNDVILNQLQSELGKIIKTENEKQCAGYCVAAYVFLLKCIKNNIPLILYQDWMSLSGNDLQEYLYGRLPEELCNENVITMLEKERDHTNNFLTMREEKYKKWVMEDCFQTIFKIIHQVDPEFSGWKYLL